ncbi:hypothetical protein A2U01_0106131, partial [Trifolium medium]|nr:hypothetical protein [Trifolium medium]
MTGIALLLLTTVHVWLSSIDSDLSRR